MKRKIRSEALGRRDRLPAAERAALGRRIFRRLEGTAAYRAARTVGIFVSCRSEVDTRPVIDDLLKRKRRVAVPRVEGKGAMEFYRIADPSADLRKGAYGIMEPRPGLEQVPPEEMDMLIAPAVAFDAMGYRVGYGGGFFDRFIPRLRPGCAVVALAFEVQMVRRVPRGPHDVPVGAIITEKRILRTGARRSVKA